MQPNFLLFEFGTNQNKLGFVTGFGRLMDLISCKQSEWELREGRVEVLVNR